MAKPSDDRPKPTASAVMAFPQPPLRRSEEYLKAYTAYAFTAISAIAQEVASIDLRLFRAKYVKGVPKTEEVYEHEAFSVLQYVNPLTTFYDQVEATQVYQELTGEAFWIVLKQGATPKEIWLVRPDWMTIEPDPEKIIKDYVYHPGGAFNEKVIIPTENVIHFKYFNPLNPYRGKGSIQAAALPLDIHTFAQEWNRNFFFNSAVPGLIFTTEKKLDEKVIKRFLEQWQASYGGRSQTNKIAFLGGGMKVDTVTMRMKDMDFAEQQRMMRDDVLAVFKVPKTILGLTDDVNRANAEATTRAFMERVVTPRMTKFVNCLNEFFLPMYGDDSLFFDFVDPSPEDVELSLKRYENARKYTWMTPNEIRAEENLEPLPGGDDLFAPLGSTFNPNFGLMTPTPPKAEGGKVFGFFGRIFGTKEQKEEGERFVSKAKPRPFKHMVRLPVKKLEVLQREKLEEDLTKDLVKFIGVMLKEKNGEERVGVVHKDKPKGTEDIIFTDERKDAYWRSFITMVTEREAELKEKAIELFKEQEKIVLENLERSVKYWRKEFRKGKESSVLPSLEQMSMMWERVFVNELQEILIEQGDYTLDFLGAGGHLDLTTDFAVEFLREYAVGMVRDINETTRTQLRETLAEGFEAGEGIDKLEDRIEEIFKKATRVRAEVIARTEALRASNFATVEAYRQSEVVSGKEWLTERDDRTCPFCEELDGKIVELDGNYYDEGDTFTLGDSKLEFEYEVAQPPLHPDCRCTTIPVLIEGKGKSKKDLTE